VRAWSSDTTPTISIYQPGDWGPAASNAWMHEQGQSWFDLCPVLK
jgi:glucose-6-phosphate 1-dehydrogenase